MSRRTYRSKHRVKRKSSYRSLKRYLFYKQQIEYNKYVRLWQQTSKRLEKMGLKMYSEDMYNKREFFENKASWSTDYPKDKYSVQAMVRKQAYKFTRKQAIALRKGAKEGNEETGEFKEQRIYEIMTNRDFELDFLSDVNNELKELFPEMTGTERAKYIKKEYFGYAS